MLGAVVSAKVMCCTQLAVLPAPSVAVQVRSMPAWPVQLAAVGASLWLIVTVEGSGQPFAVVGVPVLLGLVESPQASTLSAGQMIETAVHAGVTIEPGWVPEMAK